MLVETVWFLHICRQTSLSLRRSNRISDPVLRHAKILKILASFPSQFQFWQNLVTKKVRLEAGQWAIYIPHDQNQAQNLQMFDPNLSQIILNMLIAASTKAEIRAHSSLIRAVLMLYFKTKSFVLSLPSRGDPIKTLFTISYYRNCWKTCWISFGLGPRRTNWTAALWVSIQYFYSLFVTTVDTKHVTIGKI